MNTTIISPKINFHILIPEANNINTPNITILKAVPKSGWITTKKREGQY